MDRLNGIITEFLHYSRPADIQIQDFDLHSVLSETIELLKRRDFLTDSISFKMNFSAPLVIKGDQQKFQQVFWNLGNNALDAMPEWGELSIGTLENESLVRIAFSDKGGELSIGTLENESLVRIAFSDTGSGIKKEDIEKVFYPFFTTKEEGTGLGLSIAYRIVEDHGGTLTIKSDAGKGTKVHILLPKSIIQPSTTSKMADNANGK
jgi:signal transduction histidine kinase